MVPICQYIWIISRQEWTSVGIENSIAFREIIEHEQTFARKIGENLNKLRDEKNRFVCHDIFVEMVENLLLINRIATEK